MTYTSGYAFDIFVSYASSDNREPVAEARLGWVSVFVHHLRVVLASRLGAKVDPELYFDQSNLAGNHELDELLKAVRSSALMIAICSPAYNRRDWTRKELATFVEGMTDSRRLFVVEMLPLDEGEQHLTPLDQRKRFKFWERDGVTSFTAMPLAPSHPAFRQRIHDLAEEIKKQLMAINTAEITRPAIRQAAEVIAVDTARTAKGVVYLAQVTDDLEEERLQVQRTLDQFGYQVLPALDLPGGGEAFRQQAEADIRRADLYVHLLGPRAGRNPTDLPDGYAATQLNLARHAGKELLLWRHPELDLAAVKETRHRALLEDVGVMAVGLVNFSGEIRRRLELRQADDRPEQAPPGVFINASRSDYEVAQIVKDEFAARNMYTSMPLYDGEPKQIANYILNNMCDCDVLVFIYGTASPFWVGEQLRQFKKSAEKGRPKRLVALCIGPPDEKPTDLPVNVPNLRKIAFPGGWSRDPIRDLINETFA